MELNTVVLIEPTVSLKFNISGAVDSIYFGMQCYVYLMSPCYYLWFSGVFLLCLLHVPVFNWVLSGNASYEKDVCVYVFVFV